MRDRACDVRHTARVPNAGLWIWFQLCGGVSGRDRGCASLMRRPWRPTLRSVTKIS